LLITGRNVSEQNHENFEKSWKESKFWWKKIFIVKI
jgi:hypothetical protein